MRRGLFIMVLTLGIIVVALRLSPTYAQNAPTPPPTNTPRGEEPAPSPTQNITATARATATATITPTTIGPVNFPDNYNSLTGLPYPDEAAQNRRNLILKISNFPEVVRPQYGLSLADVVLEYEAEGGVTRFAAIYRSHAPEMVGSVRSARLLDLELVNAFNAMLGYSGSNEWIMNYILTESDWRWQAFSPQIGSNCPMFCRIRWDSRAFEHTLFANTAAIWQEAERLQVNYPQKHTGFAFDPTPQEADATAQDIAIDWYSPRAETRWQYNPDDAKYYRYDSGLPHIDAASGAQLTADNVVIIEVWHVDRPDVFESEVGGIALEHQLWGTGSAWVFRDGNWYTGEWFRNQERGGLYLRYLDADKTPIMLKPGQTWIEIVRKQFIGSQNTLWSVVVSDERVNAQATATRQSGQLTAVPAATQTQFAEWYGSPTPSQTWTPTPTGTWQYGS